MLDNTTENNPNPTEPIVPATETPVTPTPVQEMPTVTTPSVSPENKGSSKKGLLIISILALLGLVIVGALALMFRSSSQPETTNSQVTTPPVAVKALAINLKDVTDGDIINTKTLKVTGTTNVKATVTVVGGAEDIIFETDGDFAIDIPLNNGENKLVFTAQDSSENQVTASRSVFFTEETI